LSKAVPGLIRINRQLEPSHLSVIYSLAKSASTLCNHLFNAFLKTLCFSGTFARKEKIAEKIEKIAEKIGLESQAGAPRVSGAPEPGNSAKKHGAPDAAAGLRP
jgi:hypothetical protein